MAENPEQVVEDSIFDAMMGDEPVKAETPAKVVDIVPEDDSEDVQDEIEENPEGDEGEEEIAAQEASEDESGDLGLVEVEYDGVIYEVPNTLKDAILRQKDYTQKTQEVAETRKEVELRQQQVEVTMKEQQFVGEIQPELNNIGYLQAQIQAMENDLQTNLSNMTSEQMFRKKIEVDGLKEQMGALSQGLQTKYREFEEAQKQSYQELLEKGAQVLKKAIPDWSEDKQQAVRDYALGKGFSQQEVSSIIDPRHVQILYAAQQYEALKQKAKPTAAAAKGAATIQPKARPEKMDEAAKTRLKQNKIRKTKGLSNADRADQLMDTAIDRFL